ncbi:MAG: queuosine precursor transporter [Amylibacter sp.]
MNRGIIFGVIAMATIVVASNILVQFLYGDWLTFGAFTYPFAFLVTDLMNRLYGAANARKVVLAGFVIGIACSFVGTQIMGEFGPLVTLRIAIGSGTAYLVAQLADVFVFDKMRKGDWWKAPLVSTLVGSSLDTAIFFSVAFSASLSFIDPATNVGWANEMLPILGFGPIAPLWASLGVADWFVKVALSLVALLPFKILVSRLSGTMA